MAVEAGGFTGIIEPDEVTLDYLVTHARPRRGRQCAKDFVKSDAGRGVRGRVRDRPRRRFARWSRRPATRATALPIDGAERAKCKIDTAYGGSCTGGKMADMDMYAAVLQPRRRAGQARRARRAPLPPVRLAEDQAVRARSAATSRSSSAPGAELIDPSCGACINAGPGASHIGRDRSRSARRTATSPAAAAPARSTSPRLTSSPPRPSPATSSSRKSF